MREKNKIKMLLGDNIKYYRVKSGYTRGGLSEKVNCHVRYLGEIENGWSFPSSELLLKIATILEVPIASLFMVRGFDPDDSDDLNDT